MPSEAGVIEQIGNEVQPAANDWRPHLTDELRADPVVAGWADKAAEKDIPGLIKGYAHLFKQQGGKVMIPGKDAKPEDVSAFKAKLIEAGMLPAPIKDAKEYAIAKPENLPAGMQWSDELTGKFASTLHKYQVPKEAVADFMALHMEAMGGVAQAVTLDREQSMAALKAEHGEKYDERVEMVSRMMPGIFSQDTLDFFDQTGIGNDPKLISALMRLAPLAMQDSSFIESIPRAGGEITGEEAKAEYARIMSDPTHPMHAGYMARDKKVDEYINELYRRAYGTEGGKMPGLTIATNMS